MDDKIISVAKGWIRRLKGRPIGKDDLAELREEIYKATRTNKSAPFSNVKKWIKAARKEIANDEKKKAKKPLAKSSPAKSSAPAREMPIHIPKVSQSVQASLEQIKSEISPSMPEHEEVEVKRPPMVLDKVYLQSMTFEMASMRQALDRIGKQLDKLERELNQHRQG